MLNIPPPPPFPNCEMNGLSSGCSGSNGSLLKELKIKPLPFYDVKDEILKLKELPAKNPLLQQTTARKQFEFQVSYQIFGGLARRSSAPLPRNELQLRFFLVPNNTSVEQIDAFPPKCYVRVDGYEVTLPKLKATTKISAEQKRMSLPVDITTYVNPSLSIHAISVEWMCDHRTWALGVYHVEHLSSSTIFSRLTSKPKYMRPLSITKKTIIQRLNGEDDAISMDTMKVPLLCPLSRTRMTMPVKGTRCTHLQCFDLNSYLMMNEKRPTWKCAICEESVSAYDLIIDQYYLDILHRSKRSVSDVELLKDGTWREIKVEAETISDDDDDDEDIVQCKMTASSSEPTGAEPAPSGVQDVITLDSDEDEAPQDKTPMPKNLDEVFQYYRPSISAEAQQGPPPKKSVPLIYLSDDSGDDQACQAISPTYRQYQPQHADPNPFLSSARPSRESPPTYSLPTYSNVFLNSNPEMFIGSRMYGQAQNSPSHPDQNSTNGTNSPSASWENMAQNGYGQYGDFANQSRADFFHTQRNLDDYTESFMNYVRTTAEKKFYNPN